MKVVQPIEGNGWYDNVTRRDPPSAFIINAKSLDGVLDGYVDDSSSEFNGYIFRGYPRYIAENKTYNIELSMSPKSPEETRSIIQGYAIIN